MYDGSPAWLTETFEWSGAIAGIVSQNCAFSLTSSQNVNHEKRLLQPSPVTRIYRLQLMILQTTNTANVDVYQMWHIRFTLNAYQPPSTSLQGWSIFVELIISTQRCLQHINLKTECNNLQTNFVYQQRFYKVIPSLCSNIIHTLV